MCLDQVARVVRLQGLMEFARVPGGTCISCSNICNDLIGVSGGLGWDIGDDTANSRCLPTTSMFQVICFHLVPSRHVHISQRHNQYANWLASIKAIQSCVDLVQ